MNSEAEIPSVTLEDAASHLRTEIKFNSRSTTSSSAMWEAANRLNSPCIQKNLRIVPTMALQKGVVACGSQQWQRGQVMVHLDQCLLFIGTTTLPLPPQHCHLPHYSI